MNLSKIELFNNDMFKTEKYILFKTKYSVNDIENIINCTLDKFTDIAKYYIDIENSYWCVSFNVGLEQLEAMIQTMFIIHIYKDNDNNSIITISKEIEEHHQWTSILQDLFKKLKVKM
jgi:hypothetical protein